MSVYLEYAFVENFLLDGLLLYLALRCAKAKVRILPLLLAAAVGGGEALLFPLLTVPVWCAYLLKALGGVLIALLAVGRGSLKAHLVTAAAFFALTFLLGGLLVAVYSFFDIPYTEESGYLVESAPVALVLSVAGIFAVVCARAAKKFYRYRKVQKNLFACRITADGKTVSWQGFADSGNCLMFRGRPVCVISAVAALALFGRAEPLGRMTVSTVNGSKEAPVFECEQMKIGKDTLEKVCFTVGEIASKDYQIILHTACVEGNRGNFSITESVAQKIRGE